MDSGRRNIALHRRDRVHQPFSLAIKGFDARSNPFAAGRFPCKRTGQFLHQNQRHRRWCGIPVFYRDVHVCRPMRASLLDVFAKLYQREGESKYKKNVKKVFPYAFLMALCNGVCFYMTDLLASRMNAAAQFTVVTCASILLSLTVAFLFQGDRFTKKSLIASICCVIAVGCQLFSML